MPYNYEQALEAIADEEIKTAIASRISELESGKTKVIGEIREKNDKLRKAEAELASAQSEIQSLLEGSDPTISIDQVVKKVSQEKRDLHLANQRMKSDLELAKNELAESRQELQTINRKYTLQEVSRLTGFDANILSNISAIDVDSIEISGGKAYYQSQEITQAIASDPTLSMFLPALKRESPEPQTRERSLPSAPSNDRPASKKEDLVGDYLKRTRLNFNRG